MTEVSQIMISDNLGRGRDLPRSPRSISPISSRRGSLRATQLEKEPEPPTPISPPVRLTRKRAASLNTDAANHPRIEDLAINSASSTGPPTGSREQVCLCQPDPKIPRPRNAFILYRQHYQAQVVAQNPGLANPEISKIIGEQWRDQPPEVKNEWKRLAEEEKQRHQRQYPDYRYQPRRAGKPGGNRPVSSSNSDDPGRCPKCGGRYISTPSTPLTPFPPSQFGAGPRNERLLPPFTPGPPPPRPIESDRARFAPVPIETPRTAPPPPPQPLHRQPQYPPISNTIQVGPLRDREEEMEYAPHSPRAKRHRPSEPSASYPSPSWSGPPQPPPRYGRPPISAIGYVDDRRGPLPPPGQLIHQGVGMMEPPPRPLNNLPQYTSRSNTFDESLRLPPLQTQLPSPTIGPPPRTELQELSESRAKSVEAMVMTIPFLNKIKVLSKISPPLAISGPSSPPQEVHGAVVAVEGSDSKLVADVGRYIQDYVSKDLECLVKTWEPTNLSSVESSDVEMSGTSTEEKPIVPIKSEGDAFQAYLSEIQSWHQKSSEITKFITTSPSSLINSPPPPPAPTTDSKPPSEQGSSSPAAQPSPTSTSSTHTPIPSTTKLHPPRIPVALLPRGFSLTTSDHFASSIPINDAYAPVDHWQWMATLWRGIIGPDLTVYVKRVNGEDREEMSRVGAVEVRTDCNAIVVRVESGGGVEEKTLRRVGFEVLEGVRSLVGGEGEGRGLGLGVGFGRI